jgi:hypothetical protein
MSQNAVVLARWPYGQSSSAHKAFEGAEFVRNLTSLILNTLQISHCLVAAARKEHFFFGSILRYLQVLQENITHLQHSITQGGGDMEGGKFDFFYFFVYSVMLSVFHLLNQNTE